MSFSLPLQTRGAIAIKDKDGWEGIFKKKAIQPTLFGNILWGLLQDNYNRLNQWGDNLLEYNHWEDYVNEGLCPYCGKHGNGQPNNIKADLMIQLQNGKLAPDPNAEGHTHLPKINKLKKSHEEQDGLWIEWVYVVDPKTYTLEVLKSVRCDGRKLVTQPGRKFYQSKFRYCGVDLFSLFSPEPNWKQVELKGLGISSYYYNKFSPARCGTIKFEL